MNKLITITGNKGKTTFSYLLAQKLSKDNNRVMIVSTDNFAPTAQYLMPIEKNNKSLGRVLSLALIDQKSILQNMISFKSNENIGLLSYAVGENSNTYPDIVDENIEELFEILKTVVDYIIVDTQTCLNQIDKVAIKHCDLNFCIATANYKGMAYRQQIKADNVIHIIYNDSPYNPFEDVKQTYKHHVKYVMDYCKSLQYIYNGALLDDVVCPPKYDKLIKKIIVKEVINDEQ